MVELQLLIVKYVKFYKQHLELFLIRHKWQCNPINLLIAKYIYIYTYTAELKLLNLFKIWSDFNCNQLNRYLVVQEMWAYFAINIWFWNINKNKIVFFFTMPYFDGRFSMHRQLLSLFFLKAHAVDLQHIIVNLKMYSSKKIIRES